MSDAFADYEDSAGRYDEDPFAMSADDLLEPEDTLSFDSGASGSQQGNNNKQANVGQKAQTGKQSIASSEAHERITELEQENIELSKRLSDYKELLEQYKSRQSNGPEDFQDLLKRLEQYKKINDQLRKQISSSMAPEKILFFQNRITELENQLIQITGENKTLKSENRRFHREFENITERQDDFPSVIAKMSEEMKYLKEKYRKQQMKITESDQEMRKQQVKFIELEKKYKKLVGSTGGTAGNSGAITPVPVGNEKLFTATSGKKSTKIVSHSSAPTALSSAPSSVDSLPPVLLSPASAQAQAEVQRLKAEMVELEASKHRKMAEAPKKTLNASHSLPAIKMSPTTNNQNNTPSSMKLPKHMTASPGLNHSSSSATLQSSPAPLNYSSPAPKKSGLPVYGGSASKIPSHNQNDSSTKKNLAQPMQAVQPQGSQLPRLGASSISPAPVAAKKPVVTSRPETPEPVKAPVEPEKPAEPVAAPVAEPAAAPAPLVSSAKKRTVFAKMLNKDTLEDVLYGSKAPKEEEKPAEPQAAPEPAPVPVAVEPEAPVAVPEPVDSSAPVDSAVAAAVEESYENEFLEESQQVKETSIQEPIAEVPVSEVAAPVEPEVPEVAPEPQPEVPAAAEEFAPVAAAPVAAPSDPLEIPNLDSEFGSEMDDYGKEFGEEETGKAKEEESTKKPEEEEKTPAVKAEVAAVVEDSYADEGFDA